MSKIQIQTSAGVAPVQSKKILDSLEAASTGLSKVDIEKIYFEVENSLHNNISTDEIHTLVAKSTACHIAEHYEYSILSARLMLQKLYKEVFGESVYEYENFYTERYVGIFDNYLEKGISYGLINPEIKEVYDLEVIKKAIKPERDLLFKEAGMGRIYKQYVLKTNTDPQKVFELPQFWLMRVAMGLAIQEKNKEEKAVEFYEMLSKQELLSSTPTLLNSGRVRNQNSSCFLLTVEDDLQNIYKTFSDIAMLSKYAGGIGVDFSNIRASGSLIKGTNGKSLGLVPFLKVLDSSAAAVNQGGVRKGAVAAYLEPWHKDIYDFISTKYVTIDENRRCPNIHTVAWMPDLFFKRILSGNDKWTLFSPCDVPDLHGLYGKEFEDRYEAYENDENTPKETTSLKKLWEEMITSLLGKGFGHPWITFKDPSNAANPQNHIGPINSSNLCTEIMLPTSKDETAVCNLCSINLSKFFATEEVKNSQSLPFAIDTNNASNLPLVNLLKKVDWQELGNAVKIGIRMLDNVIDINFYNTKEAKQANQRHRPVGLGTMGLQSLIQKMQVPIDNEIITEFNDKLFEYISYHAIQTSTELAKEKGIYQTYQGSKWSEGILPIDSTREYMKNRGYQTTNNLDSQSMDWNNLKEQIKANGMRNSQVMAIAPTRSISYIAATSPSIEPWDSNVFTEVGMTGKYTMINSELVDTLEKYGYWTPEIITEIKLANGSIQGITQIPQSIRAMFKTAWEIHPKHLIAQNARRQKWIDMAISFNQWLPTTNGRDASRLYIECWKAGLKSTYYLHSRSLSQAEKTAIAPKTKQKYINDLTGEECEACQ